jgi:hypothetical protein
MTELLRLARDSDTGGAQHGQARPKPRRPPRPGPGPDTQRRRVEFVEESLVFTGKDSPMANLVLSVSLDPRDGPDGSVMVPCPRIRTQRSPSLNQAKRLPALTALLVPA